MKDEVILRNSLFPLAVVDNSTVIFFGIAILLVFLIVMAIFFLGAWARKHAVSVSPYTGAPLRRAADLPYESARRILQFLYDYHEYDNRIMDLKKASFCRDTGRIFPNSITFLDTINVDWDFIKKRYPGNYVSWGSLTDAQKIAIQDEHYSLEGFQTAFSSPEPSPRMVDPKYAFEKPWPLYVDVLTKVLVGWKVVPETEFEVLIVQKPKKRDFGLPTLFDEAKKKEK